MGQKKEPMSTNPAIQAELKRANSLVARIAKEKENAGKAQEEGSQQ
jgi:hypothetical protein